MPVKRWPVCVREVSGRGGRSGVRYEVALSSLSTDLQERFKSQFTLPERPATSGPYIVRADNQIECQKERWRVIEEALRVPFGTPARKAAIIAGAARSGHGETTLYRWCRAFEAHGFEGLARKRPADAGADRYAISRVFDTAFHAAGYDAELLPELSDYLDECIRGVWKGRGADGGETEVGRKAAFLLLEKCEESGLFLPNAAFEIGRRRVRKWRRYAAVNLMRTNAKVFHDNMPRIVRDWTGHDPMQTVIADVKHLDVMITRADGSNAYPKMIGFMDAGTGRIFPYLVLCDRRRSIDQDLVIQAFIAMATDPAWGLPEQLYLDNGSEFGAMERIAPALALINREAGREIVRAMPYNAAAKPIEPLFARLDRYCFSQLPGYTGPDRMSKKTQNHGREPEPFKGSWEEFSKTVFGLVEYYHSRAAVGGGKASPNEVFQAKIDAGWRPTIPDTWALDTAFCRVDQRPFTKQGIRIGGERYTHPELVAKVTIGDQVEILISYRKDAPPMAKLPSGLVQLQLDLPYAPMDTDGARESSQRRTAYRRNVRAMEADGPVIDPVAISLRQASRARPVALPRGHGLDQGASVHSIGEARRLADQSPPPNDLDRAAREKARRDRVTENLLWEQANAKRS